MKSKFLRTSTILFLISFLTSCAFHSGAILNSASLGSNNFKYVKKNLKGSVMSTYFLGLGGLERMTLVDDAKYILLKANPLKDNQALVNITISWKSTVVIPFITKRCTITADIVEFN